ncbi:g1530 [Coccomyxa viridis]|uniref:G1530 protein n=1 Tax=Coccomyxa viridis TaxID=1274662 RepID=A0ABP1FI68_9CHLO
MSLQEDTEISLESPLQAASGKECVRSQRSRKGRRKQRQPAFGSISMRVAPDAGNAAQDKGERTHHPVFSIASAAESGTPYASDSHAERLGVPQWRLALGNMAAGGTAGALVEAVLYPLDTIKTRLQTATSEKSMRALWKAGGNKALYSGLMGNLAGVLPASAIFMGVYEPIKQHVEKRVPENRQFLAALSGGLGAGLAASIVRVPTEVVKQRMQNGEFGGAATAVRNILKREGMKGLFAGYGSFLLRDLPFDAIEFVAYEQLKSMYKASLRAGSSGRTELKATETSVIGALAGAITGLATTPLDVIKTRLMTQGERGQYKGIVDCARQIYREEGSSAFLRGWEPRVIWIAVGGCVFFTALEAAKKLYAPKAAHLK